MFSPYFDQESPECHIDGMIADFDKSAPYELDAAAVFKCGHRYLVVEVSGCSCWLDSGSTSQTVCATIADVDKALLGTWPELLSLCQNAKWQVANDGVE